MSVEASRLGMVVLLIVGVVQVALFARGQEAPEPAADVEEKLDWRKIEWNRDKLPKAEHEALLARALFEADEISDSVRFLRSRHLKSSQDTDLIRLTQAYLTRFVVEDGGERLRGEALRRLRHGTETERTRAAIVLARYSKTPVEIHDECAASDDPRVWGWALLDRLPLRKIPAYEPKVSALRTPEAVDDVPLMAVADAMRDALSIPEDRLSKYKPEFIEGYRAEFVPAVAKYWEHVPAKDRSYVDLDGDGREEIVLLSSLPDGWERRWFFAILSSGPENDWKIASVRVLDQSEREKRLTVDDFDGDGDLELLFRSTWVGGWVWERYWYYDGCELSRSDSARSVHLIENPKNGRPLLVSGSAFNATGGGKAAYLTTTFGGTYDMVLFEPSDATKTVRAHTSQSAWQ